MLLSQILLSALLIAAPSALGLPLWPTVFPTGLNITDTNPTTSNLTYKLPWQCFTHSGSTAICPGVAAPAPYPRLGLAGRTASGSPQPPITSAGALRLRDDGPTRSTLSSGLTDTLSPGLTDTFSILWVTIEQLPTLDSHTLPPRAPPLTTEAATPSLIVTTSAPASPLGCR
ncbi:hypothetical protein GGS23DRAFT_600471 [Durotheca rogersii]|uniref:uncharacterized protein n=1 Tax=Durotheca rogersii TaxID=419775 RepID=UPI00221FDD2F|nr:uncharacterized protein GGS23DRAFT_600471 [Durotheca rogersii]KAI5859342.1 hypothetical protein GGS23DRAFT_600471 [Durotheca rogersii]